MKLTQSICLILACFMVSTTSAQERTIQEQASRGKTALEIKNYDQAREDFSTGLTAAREQRDKEAEIRFLFYGALANQNAGTANGDEEALKVAVDLYRQVLELKPESGSTMINLARVLQQLGNIDEAEELYFQAFQLNDPKRPAYITAYAEFLESQGRDKDARGLYLRLIQLDPFNQGARNALSDYYQDPATDWDELRSYLKDLVQRGEVDQSTSVALEALANRSSELETEGLLTIIVASLSRKVGLAESFLESSTAGSLRRFSGHEYIGLGVRQLFGIYQVLAGFDENWADNSRRNYDELDLSWWASRTGPEELSPRDTMRQLLRSLGERYSQRKMFLTAEACFEKAFTFTPGDPDPTAIRDLVNLYAKQGEEEKIEQIAARFEFPLFKGKGIAYRNSELEKIYQYHRTLGQIYGYLAEKSGDWGSSNKADSAIFQLEHAMKVGKVLDRERGADPEQHSYHVDPGLVDRLATAYAATDSQEDSDNLRLEAAKRYEKAGDERAKTYVLEPVRSAELKPYQATKYQILVDPQARTQFVPEAGQARIERLPASSRNIDGRFRITTGAQMLTSRDEDLVRRYLESIDNQNVVDSADRWQEMGGQGELIDLDADKGKMLLEISGEIVEIEFDSNQ